MMNHREFGVFPAHSDWAKRLQPTAVNRVLHEVRELQGQGKDVTSLMRGQPDTPTPLHIVEAANQALRDGRTGYPDNQGEPGLRRAVVEKLARDNRLQFDPDREVLITDGATCGIAIALAALIQPGDKVLLPDPIYDAYVSPINLWGGQVVRLPSVVQSGRFTLDSSALPSNPSPRAKVLLLNTPWNPVGTVLMRDELEAALDYAAAHDLVVISDEIYEAFVYDGHEHVSPANVSEDARNRTILVNSLSKSYAMTGWRVGYCAVPKELIGVLPAMELVLQQFSRGPATFVQDAAACALHSGQDGVREMARDYQARRDLVVRELSGIPGARPLVPEGGLFVMVDIQKLGLPSDQVRRFLLHEAGVVVIHGAAYGPAGEGTLRISFAAGGETLANGLKRLREGLLRLAKERLQREPE